MKTFVTISIVFSLFVLLTSFSWTYDHPKKYIDSGIFYSTILGAKDEVIITYEKPDVCSLNYLGEIQVTERFMFFCNNDLKSNTIAELKKQAEDMGGSIVYVYSDLNSGFGIGLTRTVSACVFKK